MCKLISSDQYRKIDLTDAVFLGAGIYVGAAVPSYMPLYTHAVGAYYGNKLVNRIHNSVSKSQRWSIVTGIADTALTFYAGCAVRALSRVIIPVDLLTVALHEAVLYLSYGLSLSAGVGLMLTGVQAVGYRWYRRVLAPAQNFLRLSIMNFTGPNRSFSVNVDDINNWLRQIQAATDHKLTLQDIESVAPLHCRSKPGLLEALDPCCAVCLEDFSLDTLHRVLPCRHGYHATCIDQWLQLHGVCPVCKGPVTCGQTDQAPEHPAD